MLKSFTKAALRRVGLDIQRYRPWKQLHVFFAAWKELGFDPRFVIDVGANHGDWTRAARKYFPEADYLLIEPQAALRKHSSKLLQTSHVTWRNAGLSDEPGRLELHMAKRDDSASFRPLPHATARGDSTSLFVEVTTLDQVVSEVGRIPDLLKIDAEGYDLQVLRGAKSLLGQTELVLVECSLCGRDFVNTLSSVIGYMTERGYTPVDFTDLNRSPRQNLLWLCEAAFLKNSSPLWEKIRGYDSAEVSVS
jgi:FkbM family methyltransferase